MARATKSANPAYPDAPATAPGGMSQAALRVELAEKHRVPMASTKGIKWPVLIDMVITERLAREAEQTKPKVKKAKFIPYADDLDALQEEPMSKKTKSKKDKKAESKKAKPKKAKKAAKQAAKQAARKGKKAARK